MRNNSYAGGANTNKNGLAFEKEASILHQLEEDYNIIGYKVFDGPEHIGYHLSKHSFYSEFIEGDLHIDARERLSSILLPDDVFVDFRDKTVHIFEMKFQESEGSADEKLQTCDFKLRQYKKLLAGSGFDVTYTYVLSPWFAQDKYRDVLEYIEDVGCYYIIVD